MVGRDHEAFDSVSGHSAWRLSGPSSWWRTFSHLLHLAGCVVLVLGCLILRAEGATLAAAGLPGVWLMKPDVAIQLFDCSSMICGRVIWLLAPLDSEGLLKRDKLNPDPALRGRQACGQTIIWGLRPTEPNHWEDGWFYNPDDGRTYRLDVELARPDQIMARIYVGLPLFGVTRTLIRVPRGISKGWC